jgi:hypothetical protein
LRHAADPGSPKGKRSVFGDPGRSYLEDRPKYRKSGGGWPFISGIR